MGIPQTIIQHTPVHYSSTLEWFRKQLNQNIYFYIISLLMTTI